MIQRSRSKTQDPKKKSKNKQYIKNQDPKIRYKDRDPIFQIQKNIQQTTKIENKKLGQKNKHRRERKTFGTDKQKRFKYQRH